MGTTRKAISKKTRFEIFKRDSFTCQYCGRSAPDVTLEIDHITPVKNGGQNEIMNLITACSECNSGKGARELSDNQVIKKQQEQLKELNERREQMKMLLEWKQELLKLDEEKVDAIESILSATGHGFSDYGRSKMLKTIKKCGLNVVVDAANISLNQYYTPGDEQSILKAFEYVHRIAYTLVKQESDPLIKQKNAIKYYLRNNFAYINENILRSIIDDACISESNCDIIYKIARNSYNWTNFRNDLNAYFDGDW